MAVADKTMVVDGQTYYPGDTIPDLGSWVAISASGNDGTLKIGGD